MKSTGLSSLDKLRDKIVTREKSSEWEEVVPYFHRDNHGQSKDAIAIRFVKNAKDKPYITIAFGSDVCGLLKFEKGKRIRLMRNRLRGTLLKVYLSGGDEGFSLYQTSKEHNKLYVKARINWDTSLIYNQTKIVNFDVGDDDCVILDISSLIK